jgi:ABC-2 type transport system permease protein
MKNSLLIAVREWKERMRSGSFLLFSILGPLVLLGLIYLLFAFGNTTKQHWNILIADPGNILENKIMAAEDISVSYSFADDYIELEEFRDAKRYQEFDALLEVNEKVLSNKTAFVFYRSQPDVRTQTRIQFQYERRLEEIMVKEFTSLSVLDFRKIKQPINVNFRDVYDPHDEASDLRAWVGMVFGALIFVFIFLFGMTILRSVNREKSNRIVEVVLSSVSARQLMTGKLIGIGLAAFVQFLIWVGFIAFGLYLMREFLFVDFLDASNFNIQELALQADNKSYPESVLSSREYNQFVELIYERIQFGNILAFFLVFFVCGYFFYGALFAALGATMGSESDGQQFVLPLIAILCFSLYSGYYFMNYPESDLSTVLHYLPFTSPVVVMVKLAQGYAPGEAYEIYLSLAILIVSAIVMLGLAARLYKNGILQFGHRLRLKHLLQWLKKT